MRFRMVTASRSASTSSGLTAAVRSLRRMAAGAARGAPVVALLAALLLAAPAGAESGGGSMRGHLGLGYAKLLNPDSPGGSFAIGAGVEFPLRRGSGAGDLSAGLDLGFDLLGSDIHESGSLTAELDHSLLEILGLVHWIPPRGPIGRVSLGPGLFHARADLNSAGPLAFSDLPVNETAPGMAMAIGVLPRGDKPVKVGFEIGVRTVWLAEGTWTVGLGRLTVHY